MKDLIKVLIVEDNADDAEMVVRALRREGFEIEWQRVDTETDYLEKLKDGLDVIISDFRMPEFDGFRALELLKQIDRDLPFVLVSGTIGEDAAVQAMKMGAADYLLKDRMGRLGPAIRQALEKSQLKKERRRVRAALRTSEERLRLALVSSDMGVWEWDLRTGTVFWSPECYQIAGVEVFGASLEECTKLLHPEDLPGVKARWEKSVSDRASFAAEFRILRPSGETRWIASHGRTRLDESGQCVGMVGAVQDITERQQLEERLRHSQKMEAVGQLAGGLAHDINNILTVIQGYATLLDQSLIDPGEANREISIAVDRAASLSRQLLTFSRKQVSQPRDIDLNAVVVDMTKMLRRTLGENFTLALETAPGTLLIHADPGMMQQILLNLAVNARDAMPNGGRLLIATSVIHANGAVQPSEAPRVSLRVTDEGCGIPPETLPRIFEAFYTTKEVGKGTGLGLATVQGIVRQHGGTINVDSEVNRGTTFEITFPSIKITELPVEKKPAEEASKGGTETILLVDDEPTVRLMVRRALKHFGYRVLEAGSGKHALNVFEESQLPIDLLLTDMVMPDGMGGKDLAEVLKARSPGLRVLFTSGYNVEFANNGMAREKGIHFLQKPYDMRHLAAAIREALNG